MEFKNISLQGYIDMLKSGEHFTLGKFGDGELFCLFKALGWMDKNKHGTVNADNHQYFQDMGMAIHETFINEKGYHKLCHPDWFTGHGNGRDTHILFKRYINEFKITPPNMISAVNSIYADAEFGRLGPLKEQLEKMNYVIVSEGRKRKLPIKHIDFVETPLINAWLEKDRIKDEMLEMVEKYDDVIFGISAGMGSLPIQDELYPIIGDKCTMISFGSIWDPFINVNSRGYHKRYKNRNL
jgi:hypothetical protein